MLRITLFALPLLLSLHGMAEPRVLHVPADFATIAAAVEAAAPGDTISLAPGKYPQTAQLLINKPLRIQGEAAGSTFIQTADATGELVKVDGVDGFRISGVTLEYTGPLQPGERTDFPSLLSVFGGRAEMADCTFRNSSGFGVIVKQGANGTIRHCRAENNVTVGFFIKETNTTAIVTDSDAVKNGRDGITVYDDATATVEKNRCSDNADNGICVNSCRTGEVVVRENSCDRNRKNGVRSLLDSHVLFADNTCHGNSESGILVEMGCTGTASGNTCSGSTVGLAICSVGTVVTAEKNTSSECSEAGLAVYFGARATVSGNNCLRNKGAGIRVSYWESTAEVRDNTCDTNDNNGILIDLGAKAVVQGNTCRGNGYCGILVSDEESHADVGENTTVENVKGDSMVVPGCSAKYQYQVRVNEIGTAFKRGELAYLERMAARLRKYQSRYPDGSWQLYYFYDGLEHGNSSFSLHKRPDFRLALEKWAAAYPDSCTPRIALAITQRDYAWEDRGSGWASEVTPEGWKGFREHLDLAEKWCGEAESKPDKDPYLYATWITVALGRGSSKTYMRTLLNKGMEIDPSCLTLYTAMCMTLLPRWGGSREEIKQFFLTVHEQTKENMGEKMYAYVADSQFCPGAVYGDSADWNLVKAGFEQILTEFPQTNFYLNRYCLLACVFGDKEKARELFGRIGDNPYYDAWDNKEANFRRAKRWALSDGPMPDFFAVDGQPSGNTDERSFRPIPVLPAAVAGITRQQVAMGLLVAGTTVFLLTILAIFLIMHLTKKRR